MTVTSLNLMLAVLLTIAGSQSMLEDYCGLVLYNSTTVGLFDFSNEDIISLEELMDNVTANSITQNKDTFYTISEANIIYELNFCNLNTTQSGNTNNTYSSSVTEHMLNASVSNYSGVALAFNTLDGWLYALFDQSINMNDTTSVNSTTQSPLNTSTGLNYTSTVSNTMLYKIDVSSWKAELVGEIELIVNETSVELYLETLAFDAEGNLYSWDELIGLLMVNLSGARAEVVCDLYSDFGFDNDSVFNGDFNFDYLTFDLNSNDSAMMTGFLSNGDIIYELSLEINEDSETVTYNCSLVEIDYTSPMLNRIHGLVLLDQENCTQYMCENVNETISTTAMPTTSGVVTTAGTTEGTTEEPQTTGNSVRFGPSLVNAILALVFVFATLA